MPNQLGEAPKVEQSKTGNWTAAEKESTNEIYGCHILIDGGSYKDVCTKDAPNDAKIVTYEVDGKVCYDLTRSQKDVNLFDMYWDKFGKGLKSISFGHGTANPKTWGLKGPENKKRK